LPYHFLAPMLIAVPLFTLTFCGRSKAYYYVAVPLLLTITFCRTTSKILPAPVAATELIEYMEEANLHKREDKKDRLALELVNKLALSLSQSHKITA
jgi:hypothetical protein